MCLARSLPEVLQRRTVRVVGPFPVDARLSGVSEEDGVDGDRDDSGIDGIGGAICHQLSEPFLPTV